MRTLYPANLAQEGEEVLRRDGILFGHLQRRRPLASRLLIHLRQSRADQYQWQGGAWRNGKLGFASKLALGVSYVPRKCPRKRGNAGGDLRSIGRAEITTMARGRKTPPASDDNPPPLTRDGSLNSSICAPPVGSTGVQDGDSSGDKPDARDGDSTARNPS